MHNDPQTGIGHRFKMHLCNENKMTAISHFNDACGYFLFKLDQSNHTDCSEEQMLLPHLI